MNLIWKTAKVKGEYWAFIDVEGLCNFRPVPVHPSSSSGTLQYWTVGVVWKPSSPPDHKGGLRGNHQWTSLERPENKDMHKYLLQIWNGAKELKRQGITVSTILCWTDVFFIVQTKILLFFVANFFILTIFLSFLTWLIFMDNSFPHMQKGSNSGSKPLTAGPTCARPNC